MAKACWFLVFVGVRWLPLVPVVAEDQQGGACSAKKCGNVSISDPFWLTDKETGRSCSSDPYLDFDVACIDNRYPVLRSSIPLNNGFQILNISYEDSTLYAVDIGKLDVLSATNSCYARLRNASLKFDSPFRFAPVNLNIILYNCTEEAAARRDTQLVKTRVRCLNKWEVLVRAGVPYDVTGDYAGYALEGCEAVVVPVPASSAWASGSEYEQLLNDGFLLTWDLPRATAPAHPAAGVAYTTAEYDYYVDDPAPTTELPVDVGAQEPEYPGGGYYYVETTGDQDQE